MRKTTVKSGPAMWRAKLAAVVLIGAVASLPVIASQPTGGDEIGAPARASDGAENGGGVSRGDDGVWTQAIRRAERVLDVTGRTIDDAAGYTSEAAGNSWKNTAEATEKAWRATRRGVENASTYTRTTAGLAWLVTRETTTKTWRATKSGAGEVADRTETVAGNAWTAVSGALSTGWKFVRDAVTAEAD